jgi:hypothetical protein
MLAATISEQPPQLRPIECYLSVPLGIDQFLRLASPLFLANDARAPLAICKSVELMRDRQIEGLPCELVAPVRLLLEETRVLHSNPP